MNYNLMTPVKAEKVLPVPSFAFSFLNSHKIWQKRKLHYI